MRRILGTRILNPDFLSRSWVENSGKLFWAEPADMDVVCMDRALPPLPDHQQPLRAESLRDLTLYHSTAFLRAATLRSDCGISDAHPPTTSPILPHSPPSILQCHHDRESRCRVVATAPSSSGHPSCHSRCCPPCRACTLPATSYILSHDYV